MPTAIVRIDRDAEEYVLWSTVVDDAVSGVLTRPEAEKELARRGLDNSAERFERADSLGSSWIPDWDRYGEQMFTQRGVCPRDRLREYVQLLDQGKPADHLLEAFAEGGDQP